MQPGWLYFIMFLYGTKPDGNNVYIRKRCIRVAYGLVNNDLSVLVFFLFAHSNLQNVFMAKLIRPSVCVKCVFFCQ